MLCALDKHLFIHKNEKSKFQSTNLQAQFNGMCTLGCLLIIPLCWVVCWLGQ